jgi:hypothetical protein
VEAAAFALTQNNVGLALDLVSQIETLARGREDALPTPGSYWKLKFYRAAHLGGAKNALALASSIGETLRAKCPFYSLDVLAAKAWLERYIFGRQTEQTDAELEAFVTLEVPGKKALLRAQGFLV